MAEKDIFMIMIGGNAYDLEENVSDVSQTNESTQMSYEMPWLQKLYYR
jgi:hypothetical protein